VQRRHAVETDADEQECVAAICQLADRARTRRRGLYIDELGRLRTDSGE
jgi:hypothetical protein